MGDQGRKTLPTLLLFFRCLTLVFLGSVFTILSRQVTFQDALSELELDSESVDWSLALFFIFLICLKSFNWSYSWFLTAHQSEYTVRFFHLMIFYVFWCFPEWFILKIWKAVFLTSLITRYTNEVQNSFILINAVGLLTLVKRSWRVLLLIINYSKGRRYLIIISVDFLNLEMRAEYNINV